MPTPSPSVPERRTAAPTDRFAPRYAVWELTLKCDLACSHCGSRAGRPRERELDLEESAEVVRQLAALGCREVVFIGGEAYLHPRWLEIVRLASEAGLRCDLTTGGRGLTADLARQAAEAGLRQVSVSIDGLEETHDRLRNLKGSFRAALSALESARAAGIAITANTQWNRLNLPEIEDLAEVLLDAGIRAWQVQITGPMGRAADRPDRLLQPYDMLELIPRLAAVSRRLRPLGCSMVAANNLGYFGPYEAELRGGSHFQGCAAGRWVLGIESNGDIKGCPSLPSAPYVGGNVRRSPIREIWERSAELAFARERGAGELWGRCGSCYYAEVCRGGCSWTAHTLLGRRGNMPYCWHRADQLRQEGLRERVEQVEVAPRSPFDFGRFSLLEEPWTDDTAGGGDDVEM